MKQISLVLLHLFILLSTDVIAQNNKWSWISGSATLDSAGNYGPQGTPGESYIPSGREGAVSWIDTEGNLWLLGGRGRDPEGSMMHGRLHDLWKYSISTNEWTWVSGSKSYDDPGIHGLKGVSSESYIPSGREGAVGWVDYNDNLWLFGGRGRDPLGSIYHGVLNDLWKYSISTNEWTWVDGSIELNDIGTREKTGEPGYPSARDYAISWTENNGKLWLFGGRGPDPSGSIYHGVLNDLWKHDPDTAKWIWIGGADTINHQGNYGEIDSLPTSREKANSWIDAENRLWVFGGRGPDPGGGIGHGRLNDLWSFSGTTVNVRNIDYPDKFLLKQNYPNPFNTSTIIQFVIPQRERIELSVYNTLGVRVNLLLQEERAAGIHEFIFNATGLPSGTYFYVLKAGEFRDTKKLLLLK